MTEKAIKIPRPRDPRLDFYRGLAMFIILIAHTPGNPWTLWIPARFGFSDATEIFVFASGMASAIAFGRAFDNHGWLTGTARVAYRVWQVYWAHIATFFVIAMTMAALNASGAFDKNYVNSLNLVPFFKRPEENLIGLMTLTYVPNYFDILPMYLVILAMMPLIMALSRIHPLAVAVAVGAIWAAANVELLQMPAEPWSDREWFFNPFGWQLVFFTGFAFMRGWLKPPPVTWWLIALAVVIVLATVPFAYFRILREVPELREASNSIKFFKEKTDFGLFRYIHFLALAYLGWIAAGPGGVLLTIGKWWTRVVAVISKVGQQSLAVFVTSMVLARLLGVLLDVYSKTPGVPGKDPWVVGAVNLLGFAVIIATAYGVAWIKAEPWRRPPPVKAAEPAERPAPARAEGSTA